MDSVDTQTCDATLFPNCLFQDIAQLLFIELSGNASELAGPASHWLDKRGWESQWARASFVLSKSWLIMGKNDFLTPKAVRVSAVSCSARSVAAAWTSWFLWKLCRQQVRGIMQIGNRIKAKGLGKLRWFCQMCQKQCRDENGFKCHLNSDSHRRQMEVFGQNPDRVMDGYSDEFHRSFMEHLKMACASLCICMAMQRARSHSPRSTIVCAPTTRCRSRTPVAYATVS